MKHQFNFLLPASLGLAWLGNILFWHAPIAANYPVWILAFVLCFIGLSFLMQKQLPVQHWLLLLLSLFFASAVAWRAEPFSRTVGILISLTLITIAIITSPKEIWARFGVLDYFAHAMSAGIGILLAPFSALYKTQSDPAVKTHAKSASQTWRSILLGALLSVPVLFFLFSLLSSADFYFSHAFDSFWKLFSIERWAEYVWRGIFILIFAGLLWAVFLYFFRSGEKEPSPASISGSIRPVLGWIECTIVLSSVILLFSFFVFIQFKYLFGGQENIIAEGFTYAEYARNGFNELVTVTIFSLGLYWGLSRMTRSNQPWQQKLLSTLYLLLFILIGIILISAYLRLHLYLEAYGFTRLRTYTSLFIFCLMGLLMTLAMQEMMHWRSVFAITILIFGLIFGTLIECINIDRFILRQNIAKGIADQNFDHAYPGDLSNDAVSEMFRQFTLVSEPAIRTTLGTELSCRWQQMNQNLPQPWYEQNLANIRAYRTLEQNQAVFLNEFPSKTVADVPGVMVNGKWQPCNPDDVSRD